MQIYEVMIFCEENASVARGTKQMLGVFSGSHPQLRRAEHSMPPPA